LRADGYGSALNFARQLPNALSETPEPHNPLADSNRSDAIPRDAPAKRPRRNARETALRPPSVPPHLQKRPVKTDRVRRSRKQVCEKSTLTTTGQQDADSLLLEKNSLIRVWKFPVLLRREFGWKPLNSLADRTSKSQRRSDLAKFPVNFTVSREFDAETGSQLTASSAMQSSLWGS
jgi:hypothetical protein